MITSWSSSRSTAGDRYTAPSELITNQFGQATTAIGINDGNTVSDFTISVMEGDNIIATGSAQALLKEPIHIFPRSSPSDMPMHAANECA